MKKSYLTIALLLYLASPALAYKFASGTYTGTGSGHSIDISDTTSPSVTDFQPDVCIVKGDTAQEAVIRISDMADTESKRLNSRIHDTTGILRFNATGFEIGTAAWVNSNGVTYYYTCLANDASNDLAHGTYNGNNTNNRSITISPAFQPEFVFDSSNSADLPLWRGGAASHSGDSTSFFTASADAANRIDRMNADGFRVDGNAQTNATGNSYYYFALKTGVATILTGSFTGDASDNRPITVGFQPQLVWIKGASATTASSVKMLSMSGELACRTTAVTCASTATDTIQSFDATTFTVGTSSIVNESTVLMHWLAIKAPAEAVTDPPQQSIMVQ